MQSRHGLGETLVILGQPPITGQAGEEVLYHPAPRQQRKAALCCHRRVQTCVKDVVARRTSTNGNQNCDTATSWPVQPRSDPGTHSRPPSGTVQRVGSSSLGSWPGCLG